MAAGTSIEYPVSSIQGYMDKYYYLVSSLPLLKFAEAPLINSGDFMAEAKKWLKGSDFISLSGADINNFFAHKQDRPVVRQWKDFEYSTRQELALFRRAKRENSGYRLRNDLSEIIQQGNNPLEIERKLLLLRWNFLEEQETGHFFDLEFLLIYYLKLQLLERLFGFDKQRGRQRFELLSGLTTDNSEPPRN